MLMGAFAPEDVLTNTTSTPLQGRRLRYLDEMTTLCNHREDLVESLKSIC
jgi:hypothetical protein